MSQGTLIGIDQLVLGTTTSCDLLDLNGDVAIPTGTSITSELLSRIKRANIIGLIAGRSDFVSSHVFPNRPSLEVISSRISEMQWRSGIARSISRETEKFGRDVLARTFSDLPGNKLPEIQTLELVVEKVLHDIELMRTPPLPVQGSSYHVFLDSLIDDSIDMAALMGWHLRMMDAPEDVIHGACLGALLHDTGMFLIPEFILEKPDSLKRAEIREIHKHPYLGSRALSPLNDRIPKIARDIILMHHECEDGNGYPLKRSGDEIPQYVHLSHIIDDYTALVSPRPHRVAITPHRAIKCLVRDSGRSYNREVLKGFVNRTGMYPQGSAVILSSNEVGVVIGAGNGGLFTPEVDVYFSRHHHFSLTPQRIDLGKDRFRYIQRVMR